MGCIRKRLHLIPLQKERKIMRKSIKTIGIISLLTIATVGSYALGSQNATDMSTETEKFHNNYLDLRTVTGYSTNKGLQLYTNDGNSYQLETENVLTDTQSVTTQVYNVNTEQDHDALNNALECRNGIIVEILQGIVLDNNGNGTDSCGYYIKYDSKQFIEGDKVETVLVYNPDTNFVDDILYRIDAKIE